MLNPPVQYVCGLPVAKWQEGSLKILAMLRGRKFKYKITCTECRKTERGEVFFLATINEKIKELISCQH